MGKLIVIEGLDGSGKATQTARVADTLAQQGWDLMKVSFPDYDSPSSALVKMYLAGDFGTAPGDVNAYAASAFYAVDRYASFKKDWHNFYNGGGVVLADRYATSNQIHQLAKLPKEQWQAFVDWMEDFEYEKLAIPRPDTVLYLDVAPEVSQTLMQERYANGDALNRATRDRDIHESDEPYLLRCRRAAMWCIENLGWKRIDCMDNGAMRPMEAITEDILTLLKEDV